MHKVIQVFGAIVAAIGLLFAGIAFTGQSGGAVAGLAKLYLVSLGIGTLVTGALLYSFGSIVEHLIAIRQNGERQLEIFSRLGKPKG